MNGTITIDFEEGKVPQIKLSDGLKMSIAQVLQVLTATAQALQAQACQVVTIDTTRQVENAELPT